MDLTLASKMTDDEGALNTLLAGYAAGHLPAPLHGLIAAHLLMKPDNRGFVEALEVLHSEEIEATDGAPLSNRDKMLNQIFSQPVEVPKERVSSADELVPEPITAFIGSDLNQLKWRTRLPGLKEYSLKDPSGCEASLLWIKAGRTMPSHTHDGTEITLVLKGAFSDGRHHYARGDIAIADGDVTHRPRAGEGEDCICFVVNDAPLRLTGPFGRFFQHFMGY